MKELRLNYMINKDTTEQLKAYPKKGTKERIKKLNRDISEYSSKAIYKQLKIDEKKFSTG